MQRPAIGVDVSLKIDLGDAQQRLSAEQMEAIFAGIAHVLSASGEHNEFPSPAHAVVEG
jgi:hypothetical protein